jgi:hypothetical protein
VALRAALVEERLNLLLERVDRQGHDLIVLITTGVFGSPMLRTPLIHGQHALEAWATTLVLGNCQNGVIYPLARQARRAPIHGTLIPECPIGRRREP